MVRTWNFGATPQLNKPGLYHLRPDSLDLRVSYAIENFGTKVPRPLNCIVSKLTHSCACGLLYASCIAQQHPQEFDAMTKAFSPVLSHGPPTLVEPGCERSSCRTFRLES